MLTQAARDRIPQFYTDVQSAWDRMTMKMPGQLTLVKSGHGGSSWMVVFSNESFYEGLIIGQLGHIYKRPLGVNRRSDMSDFPNDKKPLERREIQYTTDQIDQIIEKWKCGNSVMDLPFVAGVWGRDGRLKLRTE